jgi:hypothetical protein
MTFLNDSIYIYMHIVKCEEKDNYKWNLQMPLHLLKTL